jgi:diacylglycerol kinase family enzyme
VDPDTCRAIVVIGGDGTILDVMNGPVPEGIPVGVMPLGTGNVLGCALGLSLDPERVVEAIHRGRTRTMDLVERDGQRFVSIAGIGFDAYVVATLARGRTGPLRSKASYAGPLLRCMLRYRFPRLRVRVDSRWVARDAGQVIIGNVWNYGGILRMTPRARHDDGLVDVCIFAGKNRLDLVRYGVAAPFGGHLAYPDVRYLRGREVVVEAVRGEDVPVELDGDPGGVLPAHFRVLPGAATLLDTWSRRRGQ